MPDTRDERTDSLIVQNVYLTQTMCQEIHYKPPAFLTIVQVLEYILFRFIEHMHEYVTKQPRVGHVEAVRVGLRVDVEQSKVPERVLHESARKQNTYRQ